MSEKINIGVVGASGYTGLELLRLLRGHPQAHLAQICSRQHAGKRIDACFPQFSPWERDFDEVSLAALSACEVVFFATPAGVCMRYAAELIDAGVCIIDLSPDFRIADIDVWQHWYQTEHLAPQLAQTAVYGLTEFARAELAGAQLIANPGCYPTAVSLALAPLVEADALEPGQIIADCKSGASGAGRSLREDLLYCEVDESVSAYAVSGHRHQAEIDIQVSGRRAAGDISVQFVPHLMPMRRGMLATCYVRSALGLDGLSAALAERYRAEPFVRLLDSGLPVRTRDVCHTNMCLLSLSPGRDERAFIVVSAIDNLVKGAAGQAIQNMNCRFALPETTGLAVDRGR